MPKHTPGPWEARKGDVFNADRTWGVVTLLSREACREIDGDESEYGNRTQVIAEVCGADHGTDVADASLIAAAPELRRELARLVTLIESGHGASFGPDDLVAANAALAKVHAE